MGLARGLDFLFRDGWPCAPPPKQLRGELPAAMDAVVMKAMAFDRKDRYSTLGELIDALTWLASTGGFWGK